MIVQSTVFSSILDSDMKRKVASEMVRVLKPDGLIIWYDCFVSNPRNKDVKGITKNEIHQLFPGCQIDLRRVTLAPASRAFDRSLFLVAMLSARTTKNV
jgi:hypothetical protein